MEVEEGAVVVPCINGGWDWFTVFAAGALKMMERK